MRIFSRELERHVFQTRTVSKLISTNASTVLLLSMLNDT